mmetsp:Transcript_128811/g.321355  ORF Transcript_128811/g.321355 Transcript_128811/m.321355 type:complete len:101 (+) Transcript_128811:597-899(+)
MLVAPSELEKQRCFRLSLLLWSGVLGHRRPYFKLVPMLGSFKHHANMCKHTGVSGFKGPRLLRSALAGSMECGLRSSMSDSGCMECGLGISMLSSGCTAT